MPVYRPGELDQIITIQRETLTPDGMGGNELSLATLYSTRAHVKPLSGREANDWDQLSANHGYMFIIRRRSNLTEKDRIVWQGVSFNIRSISDRGPRSLYLEIEGERGVAL